MKGRLHHLIRKNSEGSVSASIYGRGMNRKDYCYVPIFVWTNSNREDDMVEYEPLCGEKNHAEAIRDRGDRNQPTLVSFCSITP